MAEEKKFEITLDYKDGQLETNVFALAEDVKNELSKYKYQVTADNQKAAAEDAARLRKIAKASKSERSRVEKKILADWKAPKDCLMALEKDLEATAQNLADGVNYFKEAEKAAKKQQCIEIWQEISAGQYPYDLVHSDKFLNKTTKLEAVKAELTERFARLETQWNSIRTVCNGDAELIRFADEQWHKGTDQVQLITTIEAMKKAREPKEELPVIDVEPEQIQANAKQEEPKQEQPQANQEAAEDEIWCRMFFVKGTPEQFRILSGCIKEAGLDIKAMVKGNREIAALYNRTKALLNANPNSGRLF